MLTNIQKKARDAQIWFSDQISRGLRGISNKFFLDPSSPPIGQMVLYKYDAKWKAILPYWDAYPLVFPIGFYSDGFLGMNLHYLPIGMRSMLFDALMQHKGKNDYLNISYSILSSTVNNDLFKPTIHRYLTSHIKSRLLNIPYISWKIAMYLPLAKWNGRPPGV